MSPYLHGSLEPSADDLGRCQTPDEHGRLSCIRRPAWLLEVFTDLDDEAPRWPTCHTHLAAALLNITDSHGEPVLVSTLDDDAPPG